ncbi:gluconokinase [Microbacterium sp. NPDC008134]|uniref:gluconokinase n=1 Tax=Microbacterium sp. NPDC008134 TaxID=3364183 RepID=UPI0036E723F6
MTVLTASRPLVVVMGVAGSGKSTVGAALADRLRLPFGDADDLHPPANVAKMSRGIPLTDDDRAPWLAAVGGEIARHRVPGFVIACSALKVAYRDALRAHAPEVFFLHLETTKQVLAQRMLVRSEHFMPLALLDSQLDTLEPLAGDENGFTIDARRSVDEIIGAAERVLRAEPVAMRS